MSSAGRLESVRFRAYSEAAMTLLVCCAIFAVAFPVWYVAFMLDL